MHEPDTPPGAAPPPTGASSIAPPPSPPTPFAPPPSPATTWNLPTDRAGTPGDPWSSTGPPSGSAWLAIAVGVLIIGGSLAPFVGFGGSSSRVAEGWGVIAALACGAVVLVGGLSAPRTTSARAIAAGGAITFLGLFAVTFRSVLLAMELSSEFGDGITPHVGFFAWCLAAIGSVVVCALAVSTLAGPGASPLPLLGAAGGILVFWSGLLVPPNGLGIGDHLFFGDTGSDAAVVVLLAGLPIAAVTLLAARNAAAAGLALGVCVPWAASWIVYGIDGTSGGLPVPWPEQPAVAAVAVALASLSVVGAFWWGSSGLALASAGGSAALSGAQIVVLIVCGATVAASAGAALAAEPSPFGYSLASAGTNVGPIGGNDAGGDVGGFDGGTGSGVTDQNGSSGSDSGADQGSGDSGTDVITEDCVEVRCLDDGQFEDPVDTVPPPLTDEAAMQQSFDAYVDGINTGDYRSAYERLGPSAQAITSYDEFVDGTYTSQIRRFVVERMVPVATGRYSVTVSFVSTQAPGQGPNGETCTNWRLVYDMIRTYDGVWRIDRSDPAPGFPSAC